MVILSGEIDVSVGSLLAVCAFVYGNVAMAVGGIIVPLGASFVVGAILGAVNGIMVTRARVPSIIATLGMLLALRGAVLLYGANQVINLSPDSRIFGLGGFGGVSVSAFGPSARYLPCSGCSDVTPHGAVEVFAIGCGICALPNWRDCRSRA